MTDGIKYSMLTGVCQLLTSCRRRSGGRSGEANKEVYTCVRFTFYGSPFTPLRGPIINASGL